MEEKARLTKHGKQRIKDRMGINKKDAKGVTEKALEYGLKHSDVKGSLRRFLDYIYLKDKKINNVRIYNKKVFLFLDNLLITVIDLPPKYRSIVDRILSKREGERDDNINIR